MIWPLIVLALAQAPPPLVNHRPATAVLLATDGLFPPDGPSKPDPLRLLDAIGVHLARPDVEPAPLDEPLRILIVHSADMTENFQVRTAAKFRAAFDASGLTEADGFRVQIVGEITDPSGLRSTGDADQDFAQGFDLWNSEPLKTIAAGLCADGLEYITPATQWCGLGIQSPASIFSSVAWVSQSCCDSNLSCLHEPGHNYGADHDQANSGPTGFNHGYSWGPGRTVMAYPSAGGSRRAIFSTPDKTQDGKPVGLADTNDNVRAIRIGFPLVKAFRSCAAVPPPSAPGAPIAVED